MYCFFIIFKAYFYTDLLKKIINADFLHNFDASKNSRLASLNKSRSFLTCDFRFGKKSAK